MTEMMDRMRLAMLAVIQESNLPVGYGIDTEKLARAALKAMREFDTSEFTFTEAEAIRRMIDAALGTPKEAT